VNSRAYKIARWLTVTVLYEPSDLHGSRHRARALAIPERWQAPRPEEQSRPSVRRTGYEASPPHHREQAQRIAKTGTVAAPQVEHRQADACDDMSPGRRASRAHADVDHRYHDWTPVTRITYHMPVSSGP